MMASRWNSSQGFDTLTLSWGITNQPAALPKGASPFRRLPQACRRDDTMSSLKTRILGGLTLLAVVASLVGTLSADAADKNDKKNDKKPSPKKADPAKQPNKVAGALPADAKLDAAKLAAHIDQLVAKKLKEEKTESSPA